MPEMKHIDEAKLEADIAFRFEYLSEFIGFGEDDIAAIHAAAEHLAPIVPQLVDAVYDKLFLYDATKRHFLPRQSGYEGATPVGLSELTLDHEMIQFRKQHLSRYLVKLVSDPYSEAMIKYLDGVGAIHTAKKGSSELHVPLVQMNALMGFVSTALLSTIAGLGLDREVELATAAAFNKLLWIQNDFINRHYAS